MPRAMLEGNALSRPFLACHDEPERGNLHGHLSGIHNSYHSPYEHEGPLRRVLTSGDSYGAVVPSKLRNSGAARCYSRYAASLLSHLGVFVSSIHSVGVVILDYFMPR